MWVDDIEVIQLSGDVSSSSIRRALEAFGAKAANISIEKPVTRGNDSENE